MLNNKWVCIALGIVIGAVVAPKIRAYIPLPSLKG